ncbi:MAG: HAD hydrolase-like protein [Candidatus Daviesbacteria bacterium]|nr:HAD hydrolase-like protein [Candidatus Daviesbacteria bacterium]
MFDTVIFDWKRTLYDPDRKVLINGAVEILDLIKSKNIPIVLIGKGRADMQQEVELLGVKKYFKEIVFTEGEKDPQVFKKFINKVPKNTLVIGDRVRSELEIGKKLGATTIWVKQGKFTIEKPENGYQEPNYMVSDLVECKMLLSSLPF